MAYIFLDESGDLGFKKSNSSNYFIITFLFAENKRPIEKLVSSVHKSLKKVYKKRGGILHCFREKPVTIERLLKGIVNKDCNIMTICLNKSKVYTNLKEEKHILYNYVTNILLDRIITKKLVSLDKKIILVASKRETNKFLNENFKKYLINNTRNNHKIDVDVLIRTPSEEKSLQAVDFISWSIFRKKEKNDENYYNIIRSKIAEENLLFP